uniref:Uncharacterized protein n=1 Tax=Glossina pallidipes TaxID=7398 RepID=A0A1A9ZRJ7_GLOPL
MCSSDSCTHSNSKIENGSAVSFVAATAYLPAYFYYLHRNTDDCMLHVKIPLSQLINLKVKRTCQIVKAHFNINDVCSLAVLEVLRLIGNVVHFLVGTAVNHRTLGVTKGIAGVVASDQQRFEENTSRHFCYNKRLFIFSEQLTKTYSNA